MNHESLRNSPLAQLVLARLREFYREPEAVFWVYGFPILMTVALGIAFRSEPVRQSIVDIQAGPRADEVERTLKQTEHFVVSIQAEDIGRRRWRAGKSDLVVIAEPSSTGYRLLYDPSRTESVLARVEVADALQRAAGRTDVVQIEADKLQEPGSRYIDFLVPGLLGMSLMGGGLWGVGFVITDMRIRKLLKRFLATPMKKGQFLAAIMISRLVFMVPEVLTLLLFGWLAFGVGIRGSLATVVVLILVGAFTFAGIGLLVASRARTIEAVSGLMNLVMLPMWILSGIFFSSERFPAVAQPFIKLLPLTPLIDALRGVMLEGQALAEQGTRLAILAGWGVITFTLALKWFRWN